MFEWEESTFLGLKALYRRFVTNPERQEIESRQALLKDHRSTLILLARMLSGRNLGIFETPHRVLCTGDRICLPPAFHEADSPTANLALYELKTITAALALRDNWHGVPEELPHYLTTLDDEFPHLSTKVKQLEHCIIDEANLYEILGAPRAGLAKSATDAQAAAPNELAESTNEITTEIEGRGQMDVEVLQEPEDDGDVDSSPVC